MVNKVTLIGRLGQDPEVKALNSGTTVTKFSLATSEKYKDRNGERQEDTEWHNVVAWGKLAEICGQYLQKGSLIYVEGKIKTERWEKDGEQRERKTIVIREMTMLGGKNESSSPQSSDDAGSDDDVPF